MDPIMANNKGSLPSRLSQPSHAESKRRIDAQVDDFLKMGGQIQQIPNGVSGQVWTPTRHIRLSKPSG
jgi:hypothetical protein